MVRAYPYVGPQHILDRVSGSPPGTVLQDAPAALSWLTRQGVGGVCIATYVVSVRGELVVADRHSEHVACAGFEPVLAAGELSLERDGDGVYIQGMSNQSTGFCPEPSCWDALAVAMRAARLPHADRFEREFQFRRCPRCDVINIIKDDWYYCACGEGLPADWNCGPS